MKEYLIGCDNAAVALKNEIINLLKAHRLPFTDVGVASEEDDTFYPEIARRVAEGIIDSRYEKEGILLCGTGIGMAITANKFPGIYAAVCHDIYSAERARLSNNTNVITMGARVVAPELAKKILAEWLNLEFKPGRSSEKIALIKSYEERNFRKTS